MIRDPKIPRLLSIPETAAVLGLSKQRVWQLINDLATLPAVKVGGTTVLLEATVLAYKEGADVVSHLIKSEAE